MDTSTDDWHGYGHGNKKCSSGLTLQLPRKVLRHMFMFDRANRHGSERVMVHKMRFEWKWKWNLTPQPPRTVLWHMLIKPTGVVVKRLRCKLLQPEAQKLDIEIFPVAVYNSIELLHFFVMGNISPHTSEFCYSVLRWFQWISKKINIIFIFATSGLTSVV